MEHSSHFYKVKNYWDQKLWNENRVRNAVIKQWITETEFKEITGVDYSS